MKISLCHRLIEEMDNAADVLQGRELMSDTKKRIDCCCSPLMDSDEKGNEPREPTLQIAAHYTRERADVV